MDNKKNDLLLLLLNGLSGLCVILMVFWSSGFLVQATELQDDLTNTVSIINEIKINRDKKAPLTKGMNAPEFSLADENGNTIILDDYKGKKVMLLFSATSCESCLPAVMAAKQLQNSRDDVSILLVHYTSDPEDQPMAVKENAQYKKEHDLPFPILSAGEDMAEKYQAYFITYSILIDKHGKIVWARRIETYKGFQYYLDNQT